MSISSLLERYKHLRPPNESVRKAVVEILARECKAEITIDNVAVKNKIVYLTLGSSAKMEVFFKKKKILEELKGLLGEECPTDIR